MTDPAPRARVAYVRTCSTPPWSPQVSQSRARTDYTIFLETYVRQPLNLSTNPRIPRHRFHFTAFTEDDSHIFEQLIESFPLPPRIRPNLWFLKDVGSSDIEIHMPHTHAKTANGRKIIAQCQGYGFKTNVHGAENDDCDEEMLQDCDYVIDLHHSAHQDYNWFWQHARTGIREDNMLTNPKYNIGKHDISKHGLAGRIQFSVWSKTSGCFHGNYPWRCYGCGGKCKRGRCKVSPRPDRELPQWHRLPVKGSAEWKELTASDVCWRYQVQNNPETPSKYAHVRDDWSSIDTFSGD